MQRKIASNHPPKYLTARRVVHPVKAAYPQSAPQRQSRAVVKRSAFWNAKAIVIILVIGAFFILATCGALTLGMMVIYSNQVMPGVSVLGLNLGGMSQSEAANTLAANWETITLRDGDRVWSVRTATLGISLDSTATARTAYEQGHDTFLQGLLGRISVMPVVRVDEATAAQGLSEIAALVEMPAVNAGVRLVSGVVEATPPQIGRVVNIGATLARLQTGQPLNQRGEFELVMQPVQPTVTDSTPMLAQAQQLLSSDFIFNVFDPVTGDSVQWILPPEAWGEWLTATSDPDSSFGLTLTLDTLRVANYLDTQANTVLDASRYIDAGEAVIAARDAISAGLTESYIRVYHYDTQHTVQAGETIISIAWDYGVPYPWIQNANGGISEVSIGQVITIPSADNFFDYAPVPNKRIIVSISEQRAWIYEDGTLIWEWSISTGINSSPTWPGVYQIISHVPNAYAANWDLYMPYFMGVYRPIPGTDFTNGFHGFPTRGGGQLLWENSIGTRVTYGCILLSNENAELLYNWAEEGVVVEILP